MKPSGPGLFFWSGRGVGEVFNRSFDFSAYNERLLLNHAKMLGFLAHRGEEFNLGPEMRLDRSELLCNKFY